MSEYTNKEIAEILLSDKPLDQKQARAAIDAGGTVWRVNNSVSARDCMPRTCSIYDLQHNTLLTTNELIAIKQSIEFVTQRRNECNYLIGDLEAQAAAVETVEVPVESDSPIKTTKTQVVRKVNIRTHQVKQ